jgi:hypothetical protein
MILERLSEAITGYQIQTDSLNLLTLRGFHVLPVPHGNSVSDDEGNVHHGVFNTDTPVGSASKDKVVSRIRLGSAVWI